MISVHYLVLLDALMRMATQTHEMDNSDMALATQRILVEALEAFRQGGQK